MWALGVQFFLDALEQVKMEAMIQRDRRNAAHTSQSPLVSRSQASSGLG